MTALSIREMNYTLAFREECAEEMLKTMPTSDNKTQAYCYWSIWRKVVKTTKKHGTQTSWKFVHDAVWTKAEAADAWNKNYRAHPGEYRLKFHLKY